MEKWWNSWKCWEERSLSCSRTLPTFSSRFFWHCVVWYAVPVPPRSSLPWSQNSVLSREPKFRSVTWIRALVYGKTYCGGKIRTSYYSRRVVSMRTVKLVWDEWNCESLRSSCVPLCEHVLYSSCQCQRERRMRRSKSRKFVLVRPLARALFFRLLSPSTD